MLPVVCAIAMGAIGAPGCNCGPVVDLSSDDAELDDLVRRIARAKCAGMTQCGCAAGHEACEEEVANELRSFVEVLSPERVLDRECYERVVLQYESVGCDTRIGIPITDLTPCVLYAGDEPLDAPCELTGGPLFAIDPCAPTTTCLASSGRCTDLGVPKTVRAEGEPCGAEGDTCDVDLHCDDALRTCVPRLGEGAPCRRHTACASDLFCATTADGTGTCARQLSLGEPCDDHGDYACAQACVSSEQGRSCHRVQCHDGVCTDLPLVCEPLFTYESPQ